MSTEIAVAIIASIAAIVAPSLSWLASRQASTDARTNIDRDIALLRQLTPGSEPYRQLEKHVERNVRQLVRRDWKRSAFRRAYSPLFVPYVLLIVLGVIVGLQDPSALRDIWENGTFWLVVTIFVFTMVAMGLTTANIVLYRFFKAVSAERKESRARRVSADHASEPIVSPAPDET